MALPPPGQFHVKAISRLHVLHNGDRKRTGQLGVSCGLMCLDPDDAKTYIQNGSWFTAVGVDLFLLAEAVENLPGKF